MNVNSLPSEEILFGKWEIISSYYPEMKKGSNNYLEETLGNENKYETGRSYDIKRVSLFASRCRPELPGVTHTWCQFFLYF